MTDPHAPPEDSAKITAPAQVEPAPAPSTLPSTAPPVVAASGSASAPPPASSSDGPGSLAPVAQPPTFVFFGILAAIALLLDVATKAWAEITLSKRNPLTPSIELVQDHLAFTLAYNKGGAWGLFQNHPEYVRRPFFLLVSLLAIAFIINLYGRLLPGQKALKWGLPLVLGGALGNLSDRIVRSNVIDFIDYQAAWIESMNRLIAKLISGWALTDHWPTFNVADIAICVGVGLMAVDMFTSRRGASTSLPPQPPVSTVPVGHAGLTGSPLGRPAPEPSPPLKPEA
jgi:signal peptidase II